MTNDNKEYVKKKYNRIYSDIIKTERQKQHISQEQLARGIIGRHKLVNIESGYTGWSKTIGDILMQRLGVYTEDFEFVITETELIRWRQREQFCLLVFENPEQADVILEEMQNNVDKYNPIETQFLIKATAIRKLMKKEKLEQVLETAKNAVQCTVSGSWEINLEGQILAPVELEAIVFVSYIYCRMGELEKSLTIWREVWDYPKKRGWEKRMKEMILPSAALVGMYLFRELGDEEKSFRIGKKALKNLRKALSQRYLYLILAFMEDLSLQEEKSKKRQKEIIEFRKKLQTVYKEYQIPERRLWQSLSFSNAYDLKHRLYSLRTAYGYSREKTAAISEYVIISPRHMERVENGKSNITESNYGKLAAVYGKPETTKMTLIATDSLEVLRLRQQISTLQYMAQYKQAKKQIEIIENLLDMNYPANKQFLLFCYALQGRHLEEMSNAECIDRLKQALDCTVPYMEGIDLKKWEYQKQEAMIIANIASIYREMDDLSTAEKWCNYVWNAEKNKTRQYGLTSKKYCIIARVYTNILGDSGKHSMAIDTDWEAIHHLLLGKDLHCIGDLFYDIAWNSYEFAQKNEPSDILKAQWKNNFSWAYVFLKFIDDKKGIQFLQDRTEKYLLNM